MYISVDVLVPTYCQYNMFEKGASVGIVPQYDDPDSLFREKYI